MSIKTPFQFVTSIIRSLAIAAIFLTTAQLANAGYEDAVKNSLKDPESARFYDVKQFKNANACGYVNAKNGFGGYAGKSPFAYIAGQAFIGAASYEVVCEMAEDPVKYQAKKAGERRRENERQSREEQARLASEQKIKAKELEEKKRLEDQIYDKCTQHRQLIVDEIKSNLTEFYKDFTINQLTGSVDGSDMTPFLVSSCPDKFLNEVLPEINDNRKKIYQIYCVDRRNQRLDELISNDGHDKQIARACGREYYKELFPNDYVDARAQVNLKRASNPLLWECKVHRDWALVGDKLSKIYWKKEFENKCGLLSNQLQ